MKTHTLAGALAALLFSTSLAAQSVHPELGHGDERGDERGGQRGGQRGGERVGAPVGSVSGGNGIVVSPTTGETIVQTTITINPQVGTSYATLATDGGKLVTFSSASPVAVSLPQANTAGFTSGFGVSYFNKGAGSVTVTAKGSTINGAANIAIAQNNECDVWSDGANYFAACTGSTGTFTGGGALQASSIALGGCNIGTDVLCTTGTATFSTTLNINGQFNSGGHIVFSHTNSAVQFRGGATQITSNGSRSVDFGFDTATPNTYTLEGQDTSTGTFDTAGGELDINGGKGTGAGSGGAIVLATAPAGGPGSAKNSVVTVFKIDGIQHTLYGGNTPTAVSNSTSASCTDHCNDNAGRFTLGAAPNTSLVITFAKPWTTAPICFGVDETTSAAGLGRMTASSTTAVSLTFGGAMAASDKVDYLCVSTF
jgi:hypothetical protein